MTDRGDGRAASAARTTVAVSWPILVPGLYLAAAAGMAAWWLFGQLLLWRVTRAATAGARSRPRRFLTISGTGRRSGPAAGSDRIALPFTFTWIRPGHPRCRRTLCDRRRGGALQLRPGTRVVARRAPRRLGLEPRRRRRRRLFYQPLFWWLRRQLRLCQDYLADDRAAAIGSPEDYAAYLVRLARARQSGLALPALGVGDRRSNLYRRVVMLSQDREPWERRCRTPGAWPPALVAVVVIAAVSGLRLDAAARPTPSRPETRRPRKRK